MQQGQVRLTDVSGDECWALLAARQPALGRIAFIDRGRCVIYPMNYAVAGRAVYLRTDPMSQLATVGEWADVAFEVDDVDANWERGWSVLAQGNLHEVVDADELEDNRDLRLRTWAPGHRLHLLRLDVDHISGRRID